MKIVSTKLFSRRTHTHIAEEPTKNSHKKIKKAQDTVEERKTANEILLEQQQKRINHDYRNESTSVNPPRHNPKTKRKIL